VLDRPSQLNLDGIRPSDGLYAPTIRYHEDTFYVVNTLVSGNDKMGNFIVTATDPAGRWSEPFWLNDAPGIDPSLFFDDDGRAWLRWAGLKACCNTGRRGVGTLAINSILQRDLLLAQGTVPLVAVVY